MKINHHIIRGYDIRGIAGKDLTSEIMEHFGRAYGTFMKREKYADKVVVGRDVRLTSEEYSNAFIKGVISTGLNVIDIGMVLVGRIYWAQYYFKTPATAMITASHNPAEYNGFKASVDYSEALIAGELEELVDIVEKENYIKSLSIGHAEKRDITDEYFSDLIKRFDKLENFKVVVDASKSTPGAIVPELLRRAGCEVVEYNCDLDGSFPLGVPDPTEVIVAERLAKEVLKEEADIGLSYDSDGDRLGVVDEHGNVLWNDVLVALFAIDVLNDHPGSKIMFNTLCSKIVSETIEKYGGEPFMWRTGHGFLKKKNQEVRAPFIGELSGHFFFSADFYNHDDGCYATLRLLDYLSRTNQTLSQAVADLPKYISSPEIKVGCPDDKKVDLMIKIAKRLRKDWQEAEVIDDERAGDGARLDMETAMFVIRYSQNGPYLTIKFEAKTEDQYSELREYINKLLHGYKEVDWSFGVNIESLESSKTRSG
ncbi:MAG: phosphomannomutase/phosphoglucomutase [Candidatus Kuenenbacteria bacterium]